MVSNKTFNKRVSILNETKINNLSNFVPNKLVTFDDRDPPWMNDCIENKKNGNIKYIKSTKKNGHKDNDCFKLRKITAVASELLVDVRKNIKISYPSN